MSSPTAHRSRRASALLVALAATGALTAGALAPAGAATSASAPPTVAAPGPAYPPVGAGTRVLDHEALLADSAGIVDAEWYDANIPFVDLPDQEIQDTYYYRWRTFREALKYTGPDDGWIVSEFLGPVGYSAPNGGISAAAAHHIYEGRWLRDQRYLDDYIDYWLHGAGSGPKPATDFLNENTTDWAHQYSFWVADATLARARVTGDWAFADRQLDALERQWNRWSPQYDESTGLYWQTPVWDAMELTASSYQSDDPYHGGDGFRPTLNAYQYGDARAIASLLRRRDRRGDAAQAAMWDRRADALRTNQERWLWDDQDAFYKHVMRDANPEHTKLEDREEIGFIPWYFHMAPAHNARAWAQLTDPQGFAAPYGPTTVERRSPWFMHDALDGCCRWDGPSWPYATSQTLTAMANLLDDYPTQPYVDAKDYYRLLRGYALTQRKDGHPYVAEAHHPDEDRWIYDSRGHSEDYNHSTFNDLVLSGLLGVRPQSGRSIRLAPLVPDTWDYYGLENLPYHGHNLSVFWDRDGTRYGHGSGLRVLVDGKEVARQGSTAPLRVTVRRGTDQELPRLVDDLANVDEAGYPVATASHTSAYDSAANAVDGQDFALDVPNTRWTNYGSPDPAHDWLQVDLGAATRISDVRVSWYDDGGGVRTPDRFDLEYQDRTGTWRSLPARSVTPAVPHRGVPSRVTVSPAVTADRLRVLPRRDDGIAVGITALQAWRAEDPRLTASIVTPEDGLAASPGRPVTVTTRLSSTHPVRATPRLLAPRGWTVEPGPGTVNVRPGHDVTRELTVTPPDAFAPGDQVPLRLLAPTVSRRDGDLASGDLATVTSRFDPADFPSTAWSDDFSTDRLGSYRVDQAFGADEVVPDLSVASGRLTGSAEGPAGALLGIPVDDPRRPTAVVVEPAEFAGVAGEDSLFLGRAPGPDDRVTAWYNNSRHQSGIDVVRDGDGQGDAQGPCCADVTWAPGDRFAAVFVGDSMSSWIEHDGTWTRLRTAPYSRALPPETVAGWTPVVGLRFSRGSMSLDSVTVLQK